MALQSTANTANPLKFSEIKTEFAASANNLRAYLKGAGIVDSNDTAPNVPSSGTISILDFLGAARVTFVGYTDTYNSGSATINPPVGATSCTIKAWGGGGAGGTGRDTGWVGGGGGGGAYSERTISLSGGENLLYIVGAGGNALGNKNGTESSVQEIGGSVLVSAGGGGGGEGGDFDGDGAGGNGGVATSGTVNTAGNAGESGGSGGSSPNGGAGGVANENAFGQTGSAPGGGGGGGGYTLEPPAIGYRGGYGASGRVQFVWS